MILNSTSGTLAGNDPLRAQVETALRANHLDAEIWEGSSGGEIVKLAEKGARSAAETIVAGGGDGTLNAVAAAVAPSGKRFGILPLGTLNHFAKDLGIPLDLAGAVSTLATGCETLVDVGEVQGRIFLNNSSIGLYPRIVRHREEQRNRLGRGKWPAFAWALLSALHVCPALGVRLTINGRELRARTPFLFIGNNSYSMDLLHIGARSRIDAGVLSVYFARATSRAGLLALALRSIVGRVEQAKNFEVLTTDELRVEISRSRVDVSTDGEVLRAHAPLLYRIRPRALRVLVPAETKA